MDRRDQASCGCRRVERPIFGLDMGPGLKPLSQRMGTRRGIVPKLDRRNVLAEDTVS